MAKDGLAGRPPLSTRARAELVRARDVQATGAPALLVGLGAAAIALFAKIVLGELAGGDTGYILLLAAVIGAAWIGGVVAGAACTVAGLALNAITFVYPIGEPITVVQADSVRQLLFLATGLAASVVVASRRASRDRLMAALDEVSALADDVDMRDRRLELMLAASGMGFWEWDVNTGQLTWSDAIFEQHGLEPTSEAPDFETYLGMIHEADRKPFAEGIQAAVEGGDDFSLEFRVSWPDGTEHWTRGAGRLFRDAAGRPLRMIGTGQDITTGKLLESERDRLLAEERRAGEFREAFVDVISHELRTPITTILGTTEILSRPDRVMDDDVRAAMLDDARAEAERLYRLVEDLLVLSRVERGRLVVDLEPLQPRRVLEHVVTQMTAELPSVTITLVAPDHLPVVSGEATYVEQVLRNLLENAAKYSPSGSEVVVSAARAGADVIVEVQDQGPGITPGSVDHVFDLFYRDPAMARTVAGSGIGLYVCRSLVEAMGGRMAVEPGPDGGSRFSFSMTILDDDEGDGRGPDDAEAPPA